MADEVAQWMQATGIPVIVVERESRGTIEEDHVCEAGMGIFVWTKGLDWRGTRSRNASIVSVISTTTDHSHRSDERSDGSITEGGPSQGGDVDVDGEGDGDGDGDVSFDIDGNEE
jgi:hypothetical protein